ncbi:Dysbindin protein [Dirofilaria immitis]
MLGSLLDALATVQNEFTNSMQKLRSTTSSTIQRNSSEAIASLLKTQAGSNLLLKYQLNIEMIEQMNDENIRLANLCSTRMGRAQQMCNERAEAILTCYDHLRSLDSTTKELIDLNNKISKLSRFCLQTELAMTHLEALVMIADTDADIASMKSDFRKEKAKVNNFLKFSSNILDIGHSPMTLNQDELRSENQLDLEKERMEEVALEEFLSCRENED